MTPPADTESLTPPIPDPHSAPTVPPAAAEPMPPLVPPGYAYRGTLGRGGMGVVYRAEHLALGRTVALKLLPFLADPADESAVRFRREAEVIAALNHANVVGIHDTGHFDGRPFLALEYCPGGTLTRRVREALPSPGEAAAVIEAVARGTQAAHDKGIWHRDIKPSNILFGDDGTAKLSDFGLARRSTDERLTLSGAALGTPEYMPPEQTGDAADAAGPAADVYSLGATLYECLTGRPPFQGVDPADTVLMARMLDPVPPRTLRRDVPADLETICLKCLHKEPRRRYATAAALADDLARWRDGEPITARPVGRAERAWLHVRKRPLVWTMIAVSVVSLVGGTAAAVTSAVRAERQRQIAVAQTERLLEGLETMFSPEMVHNLGSQKSIAPGQRAFLRKALDYFREATEGTEPAREAKARFWAAGLLSALGDTAEARATYDRAIELYERQLTAGPASDGVRADLAQCYIDRANDAGDLGRRDAAEADYRRAIALIAELDPAHAIQPAARHVHAIALGNLANLLIERGRGAEAAELRDRAIALREDLVRDVPADPKYRQILADLLVNRANQKTSRGDATALADLRRAVELFTAIGGDAARSPDVRMSTINALNSLTIGLRQNGDTAEALAVIRRAIGVNEDLVREQPGVPEYRVRLMRLHTTLANVHMTLEEPAPAAAAQQRSVELCEALLRERPGDEDLRLSLGIGLGNLGYIHRVNGDATAAEATLRQALALREALARDRPDVPRHIYNVAFTLNTLGDLLRDNGRVAEAEAMLRRAIALNEPLVRARPDLVNERLSLAESCFMLADVTADAAEALALTERAGEIVGEVLAKVPRSPAARHAEKQSAVARVKALARAGMWSEAQAESRRLQTSPHAGSAEVTALVWGLAEVAE